MMSMEEFLSQVAWPGVHPSPSRGGEASTAQEPLLEEKDEPIPPEPYVCETDPASAQEEVASPKPIPHPSPAPVLDAPESSTPAPVPDQPLAQDPPAASVLDLNEHAEYHLLND